MTKRILFTGGGTVGHITLNLILIPLFIKDGWEVHYVGDKKGIEFQEIQKSQLDVSFHSIQTGKLRRYFSWQNLIDIFKVGIGLLQSLVLILKIRPKVLFSKGGFVSVPPVIAAKLLGLPVFVHESDLSMGLANKIASKFATTMYTTFNQKEQPALMKHVGAVTKVDEKQLSSNTIAQINQIKEHFNPEFKTILFIGGSAGAKVFNDFVSDNQSLRDTFNIINISGDSSLNCLEKNLYRVDYVTDQYQALMDMADLVVTRGGSNTIFELLAMKKLHVIVPLGKDASRGDQLENADYFEQHHYARQIREADFNYEKLLSEINYLFENKSSFIKAMTESKEVKTPDLFYDLLRTDIDSEIKGG
ncbi:UDP-N-acetylglucosamine--N-acetylmuramyl-(pentapeptide) pyrophosphoryl-undecaprenol N-acetylglucosamine transferase [Streptococcus catagoni]|uniref:UDP-N-acetylglucosamine--N-acetylmuramyl- (pentapeptide) pyrophosphoryl-undecaprenol N-acetylglucosamine transferase n=1 Tax=Streptococcus catagoni TaxID=2654874 RepID=UPI001409FBBD|nr:UDP-N-acetylglucosamine--N-acetylmuramyl-(pentapeptide) pyrophosphoryl-undecaprenol N-acetylglucosamine transferase [Streptococcus catagoni]